MARCGQQPHLKMKRTEAIRTLVWKQSQTTILGKAVRKTWAPIKMGSRSNKKRRQHPLKVGKASLLELDQHLEVIA